MKSVKDYLEEMEATNTAGDGEATQTSEPRPLKSKPVRRKKDKDEKTDKDE